MIRCDRVDELAAAYALAAVPADEELAVSEHLATCDREHAEARDLIGVAAAVAASIEPVTPSPALRSRLMATIAATPQEHRAASADAAAPAIAPASGGRPVPVAAPVPAPPARPWWQASPLMSALAAALLAVAIGVGAWNVTLQGELDDRDAVLRAIAGAEAAHPVAGTAGEGWLVETEEGALFVATGLAELPADRLYELWLIAPDAAPVAVGTVEDVDDLTIVVLEREVEGAATFAVTVEAERVEAPTSEPVLVGSIGS